jgi:serine/threonine protein kinase
VDHNESLLPFEDPRRMRRDKAFSLSNPDEFWIPQLRRVRFVQEGGQAQVFRALDQENRWVAVKVLHARAQQDRTMQRRLRKEAQLMRGFDHPCILPLYREGVLPDGRPYLISPWLDGLCLCELPMSLTPGKLANFFVDVFDAVGHAHQAGVLHGDLHPRNLFMTERFRACVLDFGVAKIGGRNSAESETRDGELLGVESYSALEVLRYGSKHATAASDVYSLGLILREFAPRFESLGLPGELDRLLKFCCSASRGGRYRNAAELASAFSMWRNRMPVPSPHKRGVSRRSLIAAAPLLLVLASSLLTPWSPSGLQSGTWSTDFYALVDPAYPALVKQLGALDPDQQAVLREVCASVEALHAPYDSGTELEPSGLRRAACALAAAQLQRLGQLPESATDLVDLLDFQIGLAKIDALIETVAMPDDALRFRIAPVSNQELQVLRSQRDRPLARILEKYRGTQFGVEAEFRSLMQEARLPQSRRQENAVDPLIGWTRQEAARYSELLELMEENGAPSEWVALGKARRNILNLKAAQGGRQVTYQDVELRQIQQIESGLRQFPNQQAFEVRHMRAELADLMGD